MPKNKKRQLKDLLLTLELVNKTMKLVLSFAQFEVRKIKMLCILYEVAKKYALIIILYVYLEPSVAWLIMIQKKEMIHSLIPRSYIPNSFEGLRPLHKSSVK